MTDTGRDDIVLSPLPLHHHPHSFDVVAGKAPIAVRVEKTPWAIDTVSDPSATLKALPAAREAAMSRLYGGIHYPMANNNGAALGRCIGEKVIERIKTRAPA